MFEQTRVKLFVGKLEGDASPKEAVAAIYPARIYEHAKSWASIVRCPLLFRYDQMISGVDEELALKNATYYLQRSFAANSIRPVVQDISLASFLSQGGLLPWEDDDKDLDASNPSYAPMWLSPVYFTPEEPPISELMGRRVSTKGTDEFVSACIFRASYDEEAKTWGSLVQCPIISPRPKKIFGVDGDQAQELAEEFVISFFEHFGYEIVEVKRDAGQG